LLSAAEARRGGVADAVRSAILIDGVDPGALAIALMSLRVRSLKVTLDVRLWLRGNLLRERKLPAGVNSITSAEAFR